MTENLTVQSNAALVNQYTGTFSQAGAALAGNSQPQKDGMSQLGGNSRAHEVIDLAIQNASSLGEAVNSLASNVSSIAAGIEAMDQGISQSMGPN